MDPLEAYASDLTELARAGRFDPVIGREAELERTVHILARRGKNNPVLVGEPGVGKTALAEGLAQRVADGRAPGSCGTRRCSRWTWGHCWPARVTGAISRRG